MTIVVDGTAGVTFPNSTTQTGAVGQPTLPFTTNGVVYASSTSALATGSAVTWTGTNFGISTASNTTLSVRNTAAGTGNFSQFNLGNDTDAGLLYMQSFSSTYTTSGNGLNIQNGSLINGEGPGGLNLAATQAPIRFFSGGSSEVGRFDSSGNLLVGTTSAFNSYFKMSLKVTSSYGGLIIQPGSDSYTAIQFNNASGSSVGNIGCSSSTTTYSPTSDARLKTNVTPITNGLERISKLKPVDYDWVADGVSDNGFIAQDLLELPEFAHRVTKVGQNKDGEEMYGVDYMKFVAVLTSAIQELSAQVTTLQTQVTALQGK
jgi:hypothetical protein